MWKLTIEDDEGQQTQMPLAHDEYGVGRDESNSIRLTDRNVSRKHAGLKKNGDGWVLTDLSSYNGTYVNGARVVGEHALQSGDIVQLGDYRLELLDEILIATVAGAPAPAHPPVHQRPNRLVVVVGPNPGTEFPLDKEHFTVGRSEDATISINHSSVSRMHAELFALGNGRFEIVDKSSANGIRINGVELKRGILEAGDALELGDVRLRFVGAGKIFRADMTQTLQVAGVDKSSAAGLARTRLGKALGIGAAVLAITVVGIVAVMASGNGSAATTGKAKTHLVTEQSAKQLKDALKLLDAKDFDGAHKVLTSIPEDDRPTDDADFKKVEAAWVDWRLQALNDAADTTAKRALLKDISQATLDAKQRARVADLLNEINAKEPPPPEPTQRPVYVGPGTGQTPTPTTADATTTVTPGPVGPAPELSTEAAQRKKLEPRVWSGRADVGDIKMLRAICRHMQDHACVARATEALKKKEGQ
jgi:pSer/pThr/pTyr-binding forkhead associated (FHA) protein